MDEGMMDVDDSPDNVKGAPKAKPIPAPREGKKNAKDKELNLMSNINDNISKMYFFFMGNAGAAWGAAAAASSAPPADCIGAWSHHLATRVRRMPEPVGDDFMFEVNTLAHQYTKKDGSNK